jgi:murein L,D-transpeptidase YcbB/YkuD
MPFICMIRHPSLFGREDRAFSHVVFVCQPKELAAMIMKNDKKWNPAKIETAMNSGEEYWYTLKTKFRYTLVISPLG